MKVVELRAERAKIYDLFDNNNHYYSSTDNRGDGGIFVKVQKETEKVLKENYENDKALLERLDKINNILMESDANTYIDVHGKHLSIATARMYLAELSTEDYYTRHTIGSDCEDMFIPAAGLDCNLQDSFYFNCLVEKDAEVILDPMHLKDKRTEFENKRKSWKYDLFVKVVMSDSTTEVSFIE